MGDDLTLRLRRELDCSPLTREMVARELDVSLNTVYRWARGEVCPSGLYRIALQRWLDERESQETS